MKSIIIGLSVLILSTNSFAQGSLTPPGAPGETMKTLDQLDAAIGLISNTLADVSDSVSGVESRIDVATLPGDTTYRHVISQPGSYYVSGNLMLTNKSSGIWVNSDHVSLDLNGYVIQGRKISSSAGIHINGASFAVKNGVVKWFYYGIRCESDGCRMDRVTATECQYIGILSDDAARLTDCRAIDNDLDGIRVGSGTMLNGCVAIGNSGQFSIQTGHSSVLRDCSAVGNDSEYGYGISAGDGCSLIGCVATDNQGKYGIYALTGSTLNGCAAFNNEAMGPEQSCAIYVGSDSSLIGCSAYDNEGVGQSAGIMAGNSCSLLNCVASENVVTYGLRIGMKSVARGCSASGNQLYGEEACGLKASYGSTIINCIASDNEHQSGTSNALHGVGIYVQSESIVRDCVTTENSGDGICVNGTCLVADNISTYNAYSEGMNGAGIHVVGEQTRVEGNQVANNRRGIEVSSTEGLIIRNSAFKNGVNYDIAPTNHVGTIQTNMPAVGGPWDNFSF